MKWYSYINSAVAVLGDYHGEEPFASALKKFFAANRKFGSRDRKWVSHLCYCYFRSGSVGGSEPSPEKMINAVFLCSSQPNEFLEALSPLYNEKVALPTHEKITFIQDGYDPRQLFPLINEVPAEMDKARFAESHLVQPDLFIRVRPGQEKTVFAKMESHGLQYNRCGQSCISFSNATAIDKVLSVNREIVIQDLNSQRTGEFLRQHAPGLFSSKHDVWDCCAASGGKSIMLYDAMPSINLTVSDIRESIVVNLRKRFAEAGISRYRHFIADLSKAPSEHIEKFDLVLADVPCSGSGTWGRTPEQLKYFTPDKINRYASLQQQIAINVAGAIRPGGFLFYITCSVFTHENEKNVEIISSKTGLQLISMKLLQGYGEKADTLFVALFKKAS